ncbi:hypothetical protein QNI16_37775 [Cytophagaceae bacterium YF14B1]|uniref:Uncharacterized protein n=1 Tax=Xanthocytophaga flava TaxID=3048013 RepID=A0AAE3QWH1_9BACT|nr:hypothetical protein [Xanthocytophaga flavus]MDJ1486291.1 hypothetical protein [Xanthocytophaga flavus]
MYTTSGDGLTNGTLLTSNSQLQPNSYYNVFIQDINGNTAPQTAAIWVRSGDGFVIVTGNPGTTLTFPQGKDVGPGPGCTGCVSNPCPPTVPNCSRTARFMIRTLSDIDFVSPMGMRIWSLGCGGGDPSCASKYTPRDHLVLFPYQN